MSFSISTSLMRGNLIEKTEQAQSAGFSKIDINIDDIRASDLSAKDIEKHARKLGLSIGTLLPLYNFEGQKGQARENAFARINWLLDQAVALKAEHILIGASHLETRGHTACQEDFKEAAELAKIHGVKLGLLAMPWSAEIQNPITAYEMVVAVDHPNFGLAINSYFALADGSKPAKLRTLDGKRIFICQLADAPFSDFDIRHLKHEFACLPGLGDLNLLSFLRTLEGIGYQGDLSLARMGRADEAHRAQAADGFRALANLTDQAGWKSTPAIPSRASIHGVEFLEFVIDEKTGEDIRYLLQTLCFRLERRHKNKPVELWRQGAINIVLNQAKEGQAARSFHANGAGLCDMGLRVDDAQKALERAANLGIEPIHQETEKGELNIPAIEGIGHSLLHFMDERSNLHHVWDIEFEPVQANQIPAPAGLRRIDHIAQTMAAERLNHWLLFYLSVFNMQKSPLVDVRDPAGMIYSQSVESTEGEVSLNLNGASSQSTLSGAFLAEREHAGVQHIALLTDDIFETADRLQDTSFAFLPIPQNYYDALGLEFGLDASLISAMQKANILYSRNETGEYFQIYSQPIWSGFFVEIVERRSGYSGYGARNAPIRLAAQARHQREALT